MDSPSGYNLPRRKSRLRPLREEATHRRPTDDPHAPDVEEGSPVTEEEYLNASPEASVEPVTESTVEELSPESSEETVDEADELPPAFRLNRVAGEQQRRLSQTPWRDWRWWAMATVVLMIGLLAGFAGGQASEGHKARKDLRDRMALAAAAVRGSPVTASDQTLSDMDAAFAATKAGKYTEAREKFDALSKAHPEWPSMPIEVSRTYLYEHQAQEAQRILTALTISRAIPDADFMLALLHLTNKEYALAEASFANAVALDPSRPDFYYFWGECLRRDGRPREAVDRFRSAMLRNQYENAEGLYQLKLWLSEIQADQESGGASAAIDKVLASSRPSYEAYFAAASREIKAKRFQSAADFISKAHAITEPAVFRVILQDSAFLDESGRSEFAPFYKM